MKQMKVALPDDLRQRLDAASKKSGESIAEEIRTRLQASFARDVDMDKASRDFLEGVARLAAEIELERAAWHKHAGAHEIFLRAILSRLATLKPEGSAVFGDLPKTATIFGNDPNKLGSMIEFRLRRDPNFTTSSARQLLMEEFQMMGSPRVLLDQQQRKSDQPKKRGK